MQLRIEGEKMVKKAGFLGVFFCAFLIIYRNLQPVAGGACTKREEKYFENKTGCTL